MKPAIKDIKDYQSLDEIRQRKDEVLKELQKDSTQVSTLWNEIFLKKDETSKADYIASLVSNGIMAFDAFMLIRKLMNGYKFFSGKRKKKKR